MRKEIYGIILVLLILTSILSPMFNIRRTKAESKTWIVDDDEPADFSSIKEAVSKASNGDTILVRGGYYVEAGIEVDKQLKIIAEDAVIVDGQGVDWEIFHVEANDVTISGFTLINVEDWCIKLVRSSRVLIKNNVIKDCKYGMRLYYSKNNVIEQNVIQVAGAGIILSDSDSGNIIKDNEIEYGGDGVDGSWSCNSNVISGNKFKAMGKYPGFAIILHFGADFNIIERNFCESGLGISVKGKGNIISENSLINCSALNVEGSKNVISNNIIIKCDGIKLFRSTNCSIDRNFITECYEGIYLSDCSNLTVKGNIINRSGWFGICLSHTLDSMLNKNIINGSSFAGVELSESYRNSIVENFIGNTAGVEWQSFSGLGLIVSDSRNNIIYHNDFVNNSYKNVDTDEDSTNIWDNGYPSGGNYWSDYKGVDADGDGIGDTPYVIDEKNRDRYPLMKPYNIPVAPPSAYILHVQSSPITGIEISYSGDYSGTGITNFDIGPKNSPFTVTLTVPSTYQDYKFDHWELDGISMGQSNSLRVEVNNQNSARVAKAIYKRFGYYVRFLFGGLEVEKGGVLHVYFQTLKSGQDGSDVPINGVLINWKTPFGINNTVSETYNGVDGVVHLAYNLSSYSETAFTIEMLPAQYNGFDVLPPSVNPLVFSLKPRCSMLVFGTELDFGASCGVNVEGSYDPYFLLANDGSEIYSAGFSEASKMGFGVDYHLLKAEVGTIKGEVGGCARVGILSGKEYGLNDLTVYNQKTLLKYLITKWILKNVRCITPDTLRSLVDGLLAIVDAILYQNGLENYRSLIKLGAYGDASLGAEVYVGLSSNKGSAKNKITKLLYAGITGDVEVDTRLNIYGSNRVGFLGELSFDAKIEAGAGLDMGFLNITTTAGLLSFSATAGVELIFNGFEPHALNFTFTMDVPPEKSYVVSFGGLLKPLNEKAVKEVLRDGGTIKFTLSVPADKLTADLLEYIKKLPRGEIMFDELLTNMVKSIASTPMQYEISVAKNPISIPINIDLKIFGIGVKFGFTYNEFPGHVVEKGVIYNWRCWPLTEYYSSPKSINSLQFIKNWYVQELFGTVVQLKEKGRHLYLHVYDSLGRHVGINYETNQIETQIPGSYYHDNMNGTIFIVLPTNFTEFKIVVDGKFAQEPIENYTLTLMTFTENRANYTEIFSTIKKGERQEYQAVIPPSGSPIITPIVTKPWWIQHQLWIVSGVIGTVVVLTVSVALIKRRKKLMALSKNTIKPISHRKQVKH